jgi:hypothetical protein
MNLNANELPEEITLTVTLIMSEYGTIMVNAGDIDGYTTIGEPVEVTFKTKDRESICKEMVIDLREKASKIRAAAESQCVQIEEKIQSLLALPNKEV